MSIINDALKKADRLKKWKDVSEPASNQTIEELPQSGVSEPIPAEETISQKISEPAPVAVSAPAQEATVSISQPPFKVTFTKTHQEKKPTHFSLTKIILIVFAACGFFVLLIGPWISMMLNKAVSDLQVVNKAVAVRPSHPEPVKVVETTPEPPVPAVEPKSFKRYSSPNVGVSVRPVPRTVQQQEPELVFKLTGISILGNSEHAAFINGKVVQVGDKVGDAEVTEIQDKQVTMKRGGRFFTLSLES